MPWDKLAPPGKTRFKPADLLPKPEDEGTQFLLERLEDTHLIAGVDGGFSVTPANLTINGQQLKQALANITSGILSGFVKNMGEVQSKLDNYMKIPLSTLEQNKQTLSEVIPSTPIPLPEQLQGKTLPQLTKHFDNKLQKYIKIDTQIDERIKRLQSKLDEVEEVKVSLERVKRKEVADYLTENFDDLLKSNAKTVSLAPEEQAEYNKLLKKLEDKGIKLRGDLSDDDLDEFLIENTDWGLIDRCNFRKVYAKVPSTDLPEYKEIMDGISDVKSKLKTNPDDNILKSRLKKLEGKRRVYIKTNTPPQIREQAVEYVEQKYASNTKRIQKKVDRVKRQIIQQRHRHASRLETLEKKISQVEKEWVKQSEKQGIKLSSQIKPTHKITINGKQYHSYDDIEDNYTEYRKLSSRFHASTGNQNDMALFYTDDSAAFNKYVALKNLGVEREQLMMVLEDEYHKIETGYGFHTGKSENVNSIDDLERLFLKREKEMIESTVALEENTVLFSARNARYLTGGVGDSLDLGTFTITTLSPKQTHTFIERLMHNDKEPALVQFVADKGTRVTPMLQAGEKTYVNEAELTLPPHIKNEIVDIVDDVVEISPIYQVPIKKYIVHIVV